MSTFLLILGPTSRHFVLHEYLFSLTERNPKKTFIFTKKAKRKIVGSHLRECVQAAEKRAAKVEGTVLEVVLMPGVEEGLRGKHSSSKGPLFPPGPPADAPIFFQRSSQT